MTSGADISFVDLKVVDWSFELFWNFNFNASLFLHLKELSHYFVSDCVDIVSLQSTRKSVVVMGTGMPKEFGLSTAPFGVIMIEYLRKHKRIVLIILIIVY